MVMFMIAGLSGVHSELDMEDAEDLLNLVRDGLMENQAAVPFLFFVNFMHEPNHMTMTEIIERLQLNRLARQTRVHLQPCCAKTGDGVMQGLDFLASYSGESVGISWDELPKPGGKSQGYVNDQAANNTTTKSEKQETEQIEDRKLSESLEDDTFLQAFFDQTLKTFGPTEMMRLSLLRRGLEGSTALATLELAKVKGYVSHATRMHFWAQRIFTAPLPEKVMDTRKFLEEHEELLPKLEKDREAIIREAYSEKIDTEATWAHMVVPPDRLPMDDDTSFWARMEHDEVSEHAGQLDSFCSLLRLSFILLKAMPRKEAIQRMDVILKRWEPTRPFHETRQYVALQFAHLALVQHPVLQEKSFADLQERCPELCEEDCIYKYYSEQALSEGRSSFRAPDLQPLPTKLDQPLPTWHEQLTDEDFLQAVQKQSLTSWGLPSLARLAYVYLTTMGRRQAVRQLLEDVENLRGSQVVHGVFTHETLAYFTLHMIHYFIASQKLSMSEPFGEFVKKYDKILDLSLYRSYYSDQAIHCSEARVSFVLPDLCPLPDLLPTR